MRHCHRGALGGLLSSARSSARCRCTGGPAVGPSTGWSPVALEAGVAPDGGAAAAPGDGAAVAFWTLGVPSATELEGVAIVVWDG